MLTLLLSKLSSDKMVYRQLEIIKTQTKYAKPFLK